MTSRRNLLQARLATVRRDLDDLLPNITQDILDWSPAEDMRTIGGQLVEIIATEIQLTSILTEGKYLSDEQAAREIGDTNDLTTLTNALTIVREGTLSHLNEFSEADLQQEIEFDGGWLGSMGLPKIPRAEVFLNIADHEWYHVGQLTSYLWARGIDPYK